MDLLFLPGCWPLLRLSFGRLLRNLCINSWPSTVAGCGPPPPADFEANSEMFYRESLAVWVMGCKIIFSSFLQAARSECATTASPLVMCLCAYGRRVHYLDWGHAGRLSYRFFRPAHARL